jgi:hypothetical protein
VVEVVADELERSLRWATAMIKVTQDLSMSTTDTAQGAAVSIIAVAAARVSALARGFLPVRGRAVALR